MIKRSAIFGLMFLALIGFSGCSNITDEIDERIEEAEDEIIYVEGLLANREYTIDVEFTTTTFLRQINNDNVSSIKIDWMKYNGIVLDSSEIAPEICATALDYNWYYYYIESDYSNKSMAKYAQITSSVPIKAVRSIGTDSLRDNLDCEIYTIEFDEEEYKKEIERLKEEARS